MLSNFEIMDKGINCLLESLGTVETEQFISLIMREKFDYTKWAQQRFAGIDSAEFNKAAVAYAQANSFQKKN